MEGERERGNRKEDQRVAFYRLFSFGDRLDIGLMVVGTISAILNGLAQPLMTLIFGNIINSFGTSDPSNVLHEVSKVNLITLVFFVFSERFHVGFVFFRHETRDIPTMI